MTDTELPTTTTGLTLAPDRRSKRALNKGDWPFGLVIISMGMFIVVFARLVKQRHDQFRTIDFDLGIHDQSIWLLSRFSDFCTVRGLPVFGHHAVFAYVFLIPMAWLGAGPNMWNVLQVLALAISAVPLYCLACDRLHNAWLAVVPAIAWVLQPPVQAFAWETFHPEVVALPFLLWAYLAGERKQWKKFAVLLFLTVIWKEDLALAVFGLGLLYVVRRRRKVGLYLMTGGLAWFVIFGAILVPKLAGGKTVYGGLYGDLGDTSAQVLMTGIKHPTKIIHRLQENHAGQYTRDLLAPTGFSPLAAPGALLIGLPQAAINLLTLADFTRDLRYHYQAVPMAATAIAMVEALGAIHRRRRLIGRGLAAVVLVSAFIGTSTWGLGPASPRYSGGYWPLAPTPDRLVREQSLRLIADDDGVAGDYFMVPHLTHRKIVYTFPNPWTNKNYGISPASRGNPAAVRWLAIDRALLGDQEKKLLATLLDSGEFEIRLDNGSFLLAERLKPPPSP